MPGDTGGRCGEGEERQERKAFQADGKTSAKTWTEGVNCAFLELALKFGTAQVWRGAVICVPGMGTRRRNYAER